MRRALRLPARALKGAAWLALWAAAAAAFAGAVFLARPGWFINTRTASFALKRFGSAYAPTWKALRVEVASPGFLKKRVVVSASDLCADAADGSVKGCLSRLGLDATIVLGWKPLAAVSRVDELTLHARNLRLDSRVPAARARARKEEPAGFVGLPELVPAPLRQARLERLDVKIANFVSISTAGSLSLDGTASFSSASEKPLEARAFIVTRGTAPAQFARYDADISLDSDLLRAGRLSYLKAFAKLRGSITADLDARVEQRGQDELRAALDARVRSQGRALFAKLQARQTPSLYAATGRAGVLDPGGPIRRIELHRCRLQAPLREKTNRPLAADLDCSLLVEPAPFGAPAGARAKTLAGKLKFHASFPARAAVLKQDAFDAELNASIGPAADFYHFFAKLQANFSGRTGRLPDSLKAEHTLDAGFRIDRFEDLVEYLKGTAFAVPAPLHVLDGPLTFALRSTGPTRGENHGFEYRVRSRLASGRQKVLAKVDGRLMVKKLFEKTRTLSSRTGVVLQEVAIELPYLKVGAFPSVAVDKRIKTGDPKRDAAVDARRRSIRGAPARSGDHQARVRTEKPVLLYTNLTKDPVPIALDLLSRPGGLEGRIQIEPFRVEIFKQEARVEHLTLTPHPGSSAYDLDGKIVYKKHDVTIDILLLGSTEKPQVDFQSDPPMGRDEIVAVLFYGKSPGQLDSEQQATVGNASAGMANGAFGVVSLYLLAATPIDYVGYDPATQTYQARFKLPGGATLSIGSNLEESRTLTLRKRIMKNVELETGVRRTPGESNAITTFLQWFRRY